jgi:hypothetical protein
MIMGGISSTSSVHDISYFKIEVLEVIRFVAGYIENRVPLISASVATLLTNNRTT